MKQGIAFVPEDRQNQGIILQMSITRNITLPQIHDIAKASVLNNSTEKRIAKEAGEQMEIKADWISCGCRYTQWRKPAEGGTGKMACHTP